VSRVFFDDEAADRRTNVRDDGESEKKAEDEPAKQS
jgi:hypothetical protein